MNWYRDPYNNEYKSDRCRCEPTTLRSAHLMRNRDTERSKNKKEHNSNFNHSDDFEQEYQNVKNSIPNISKVLESNIRDMSFGKKNESEIDVATDTSNDKRFGIKQLVNEKSKLIYPFNKQALDSSDRYVTKSFSDISYASPEKSRTYVSLTSDKHYASSEPNESNIRDKMKEYIGKVNHYITKENVEELANDFTSAMGEKIPNGFRKGMTLINNDALNVSNNQHDSQHDPKNDAINSQNDVEDTLDQNDAKNSQNDVENASDQNDAETILGQNETETILDQNDAKSNLDQNDLETNLKQNDLETNLDQNAETDEERIARTEYVMYFAEKNGLAVLDENCITSPIEEKLDPTNESDTTNLNNKESIIDHCEDIGLTDVSIPFCDPQKIDIKKIDIKNSNYSIVNMNSSQDLDTDIDNKIMHLHTPYTNDFARLDTNNDKEINVEFIKNVPVTETKMADEHNWPTLTIDDISISLKVVGNLPDGSKLKIVSDLYLAEDNGYMQSLVRYYQGQSRDKIISFLDHLFSETERQMWGILTNVRNGKKEGKNVDTMMSILVGMLDKISIFLHRYENMRNVYKNESGTHAKLGIICEKFRTFKATYFRELIIPNSI